MANPNKVGLVIAVLIGGWHVAWSLLVLIGWAQPILDFIFWAHMIKPVYFVKPFDPTAAVALIAITSPTLWGLAIISQCHSERSEESRIKS